MNEKNIWAEFENLLKWMDLRDDEGISVSADLENIKKRFQALKKKYIAAGMSPDIKKNEPDDLKRIKSLRTIGPRKLWKSFDRKKYGEKVAGAWLGRAAGCTLGAPVEFYAVEKMESIAKYAKMKFPPVDYWTYNTVLPSEKRYIISEFKDYLKQNLRAIPCDDDITYTLLGLLILEDYGIDFTTQDVGKAWMRYLPLACSAEAVALHNLKKGIRLEKVGERDNPYVEWIGADIRGDPWGYAAPAWPEKAAELAYRDAYISHRRGGIYGEMFFSATISAAFAVNDPLEACEIGLTEVPSKSRLYREVQWMLSMAPKVKNYKQAICMIKKRYPYMHKVHTILNAACTIFGIAIGGRDFTKVIGNTVAIGWDNDCTAATAGSIVGAVIGKKGIPGHWYRPFQNRCLSYMNNRTHFKNDDIIRRFTKQAEKIWGR